MKVYSIFLACLLLAPSLPLAAADPVEVKIGFLNPTGASFLSAYTPAWTDAAEVAIAELNEIYDGDYEFSLTEADSGCDGTTAASAAQNLIDAGVVGIAGAACSGATLGAIDVAADAGVPMISYASSSPIITDYYDDGYLFRVVPSDAQLGQAMVSVAHSAGFSNPAVVHITDDYNENRANAFANEWRDEIDSNHCGPGGTALFSYEQHTDDFSDIVSDILDVGYEGSNYTTHDNCDSVVLFSYATDGAGFIEEMHAQHLDVPVLGGDSIADRNFRYEFTNESESLLDGVMTTMHAPIPESDEKVAFEEAYEEHGGNESNAIFIHEAYDAVMIIGHAAVLDSDGDLRSDIYDTGDEYQGASGVHTFMSSGDVFGPGYEICMFSYDDDYVDHTCPYDWNYDWNRRDDGYLLPTDAYYFACDVALMIMEALYDDSVNNCGDWSDEPNVDVFVCDNGYTIRGDYYDDWDNINDCGDWSDEPNIFLCDNGNTIPAAYVNDGDNDCGDGSDEYDSHFVCDNGETIPAAYVNDGDNDCGDWSDEDDGYFVCDNGGMIPEYYVNDGYDDCGDGSDEDGSDDDEMRFGLPTGQLGFIDSEEMDDMNEEISLKFVTPHRAEIESYGVVSLDGDTSDTLREDIILASSIREIEAYFVEGQSAIIMDYTNGEIDDEEMIEALMGLHENATQSVFPAYDSDSYGAGVPGDEFFIKFDTADTIFSYADEEHAYWNVSVTPDMVNNYHDIAWGDGMNNLLTLDMALTFGILIVIIASFEDYDGDKANATFTQMLMDSMKVCPENSGAFSVMLCVLNQYMIAATEMFGEEFMEPEEDDEEIWGTYCLDSAKQVLKNAGASCPTGSTKVFYDMSGYDLHGLSMDNVNPVDSMGLMEQPESFSMFSPDMSMRISDTSNVLGTLSENAGKETSVELELRATAFFPGVSAGDTHTFVINPDEGGEFFENVSILRVLPPSGYAITEGPKEALSVPFEETSWTFEKVEAPPVEEPPEEETNETIEEEEIVEVLEDSGLPGPGLLVILLTILGVASVRRRF